LTNEEAETFSDLRVQYKSHFYEETTFCGMYDGTVIQEWAWVDFVETE